VKTGDGPTEDANGATRNEENVIRLPRDWLGPPEELVPIGPAARARAAQLDVGDAPPPAADAFWSEDAAALHDAVQAPVGAAGDRMRPPVGLVAPVAAQWHLRLPRRPRLPRRRGPRGRRGRQVVLVRWALVAVVAAVVAVPAVLALGGRPAGRRTDAQTGLVHPVTHSQTTALAQGSAALESRRLPNADATAHQARQGAHARARTRTRSKAAGRSKVAGRSHSQVMGKSRHRPAATHHSAAQAVTEASASPATTTESTPASTAPAVSDRSSATASTAGSEGSKPSIPPGPIGIGSFTGQCNPRCP
jgi:hypothetical protein